MGDTNVVIPGMFVVVDDSSAETPCWVDAGAGDGNGTRNAGGAVDEDENHAAEDPRNAEQASALAGVGCGFGADNGGDADVEEEHGGHELRDDGSVERPFLQLVHVGTWDSTGQANESHHCT
nr:hypothetical protein CR513_48450 [Ipomoea batatas]